MPRYLVERDFVDDFSSFLEETAIDVIAGSYERRRGDLAPQLRHRRRTRTFCLLEASGPEAIRRAARCAGLPAGVIRRVSVLGPRTYVRSCS